MVLRNAKQLEGRALRARDGDIGEVRDFYFDDHYWNIRYCVVETGRWLDSREVLISPVVLGDFDAQMGMFPVDLTMEQVRNSPDIDTHKPVSRQYEETLIRYYGWPGYWDGALGPGGLVAPTNLPTGNAGPPDMTDGNQPLHPVRDPNLRSVNDTIGYHIGATDGAIGHVEDFLFDDEHWRIRYLVIETRNWWPGRKVIVAPEWIHEVSWERASVTVDLTRDAIKASPPYDPKTAFDEAYAARLHGHYGRSPLLPHEAHR